MNLTREMFQKAVEEGEQVNGSVEFKQSLSLDDHYHNESARDSLAAQLKHRVLSGDGDATYVIGVTDAGELEGITDAQFQETIDVLTALTTNMNVRIQNVERWEVAESPNKYVGLVQATDNSATDEESKHIVVGTAGHVDHGKSTLVGSLVTGDSDDGEGDLRQHLDVQPHEVKRGLSADLSYAVYGFNSDHEPIRLRNPTSNTDRSKVVQKSDKLVSFVDTVGHKPWLRTAIRGLVGQRIDYGLLVISAVDGPTNTTREHLGVLLAMDLPTIICITKTDLVSDSRIDTVEKEIESLLRGVDCTGLPESRYDYATLQSEIDSTTIPILQTSAVSQDGLDVLDTLLADLPKTRLDQSNDSFQMYIDKDYLVSGVGTVVSGTIKSGNLSQGDTIYLGPTQDGEYIQTKARSIEIHYHSVKEATSGQLVSVALKNVSQEDIERGMVITKNPPQAVTEFEADVMILNHPTKVTSGYEPVIHIETVSETIVVEPDNPPLLPGEKGSISAKFKFAPYAVEEGQKFIFREGQSKGVGTITEIVD